MRTTIVLVHGAFAESASWDGVIEPLVAEGRSSRLRRFAQPREAVPMRRADDPLALEPLGPMGPIADAYPASGRLELEPLSPRRDGGSLDAGRDNFENTSER